MIDILSPSGVEVLAEAARQRTMLAFDFDGTLAPLVDQPNQARMREGTRELLRVLGLLYPCAVVSGRVRADVAARLGSVPLVAVVGNHGAENVGAPPPAAVRARVGAWAAVLRAAVDPAEVQVEDKGFTLAVHYRLSGTRERTRERIWTLAGALPGAKLVGGHEVVNVLPRDAPNKGDAVEALARRHPASAIAFIGDDEVDEDAFQARSVTLPIRVGHHPRSGAGYFVQDQEHVDALLRELIAARLRTQGILKPLGDSPDERGRE